MPGKRKLLGLSGFKGISKSLLSQIIREVKQAPEILDEGVSHLSDYRAEWYRKIVKNPLQLQLGPGMFKPGPFELQTLSLESLLMVICEECPQFLGLLQHSAATRGPKFHIVFYLDEITPGSLLSPDNKRKSLVIWVSFLEFGSLLCCEDLWMPVAVLRQRVAQQV